MNCIATLKLGLIYCAILLFSSFVVSGENKIKVSVPSFAPFNSFSGMPQCQGATVLAVQSIVSKLDVGMELDNYPYARILHSLKSAKLDIALIFKNNSIKSYIDYIGPVSFSKIIVISQPNITINSYEDLKTVKNIAVIRNAQFDTRFDNDRSLKKINVDSYQQAISMLKHGRVDAVIGSLIGIDYALHQKSMSKTFLSNALHLGKKEWGFHLAKNSHYQKLKPQLVKVVAETFREDLIHQLYQQQIQQCVKPAKQH